MEERYLIKIQRPNDTLPLYKASCNRWARNSKNAIYYTKDSHRLIYEHNLLCINHPDWNVEIIDQINEIGTYISTYDQRYKFKHIATTILCIILIPILLPIVWIMELKDKIIQHFNN